MEILTAVFVSLFLLATLAAVCVLPFAIIALSKHTDSFLHEIVRCIKLSELRSDSESAEVERPGTELEEIREVPDTSISHDGKATVAVPGRPICAYCYTNEPVYMFQCGHRVACTDCVDKCSGVCPVCRKRVESKMITEWYEGMGPCGAEIFEAVVSDQ